MSGYWYEVHKLTIGCTHRKIGLYDNLILANHIPTHVTNFLGIDSVGHFKDFHKNYGMSWFILNKCI